MLPAISTIGPRVLHQSINSRDDMSIWNMKWHSAGHLLATGSNDRQTKFWARSRMGTNVVGMGTHGGIDGLEDDEDDEEAMEILKDEMELGNHVGIVIGRRGATIIAMQRATGTKMHVDQTRRVLQIEGTMKQIETVKKRVGALLDRVSNDFIESTTGGVSNGMNRVGAVVVLESAVLEVRRSIVFSYFLY